MQDYDGSMTPKHALSLPSLSEFRATLEALLHSPYPPRSLFIHAIANAALLHDLISASLPGGDSVSAFNPSGEEQSGSEPPSVQDLLPQAVIVDCAELASTKALFGRILNGLSGWGNGEWNDSIGGVLNWDGRQEGYQKIQIRDPSPSTSNNKKWRLKWDYKAVLEVTPSASSSASITTVIKGGIIDRKDESLSAFLEGLKMIFNLGSGVDDEYSPFLKPRFIVLLNAERLPALETLPPGHNEGTLLASLMRVGELTGKPIVPVLASSSEWLLLRPTRGATEPGAMLEMPALKRQGITQHLQAICSSTLPASSALTVEQQSTLSTSLIDLLHQTFEPYLGDEVADYLWLVEKLWPEWKRPVEMGAVEAKDVGRLVALFKGALSREIEQLGELRPLLVRSQSHSQAAAERGRGVESVSNGGDAASTSQTSQTTPRKLAATAAFYATVPSSTHSPTHVYSPQHAITPTKRSANGMSISTTASSSSSSTTLSGSLSVLARYLLISAFLASSNPAKKDIIMLATAEDELANSKRRKKGGGMRKMPGGKPGVEGDNNNKDGGGNMPIRKKDTLVPQRMLGPKPFPIERLIAITETILPVELRKLAKSQDILQEIANLTNLRLLLKTTASSSITSSAYPTFITPSSISPFDKLDSATGGGIKLKISTLLELELIENIGKSLGFKVGERLWELFG